MWMTSKLNRLIEVNGHIIKSPLLLFIPLLLCGISWSADSPRLHPPPTALDRKVRDLLSAADRIDVEIETIELPIGGKRTLVTHLAPKDITPIVKSLNLTQEQAHDWGTGYVPEMCFLFYKGKQQQAEITISYSPLAFNYFFGSQPQFPAWISRGLHPTTIHRFKDLIARNPKMRQALIAAGVKSQNIDPKVTKEANHGKTYTGHSLE